MSRRTLIAGNWKMHKTAAETSDFIKQLAAMLPQTPQVDITLAPPYTALETAVRTAAGMPITIAAQNVYWEEKGAFTGEVSVEMLTCLGVEQVIIGHSERRQYFGETDETVNLKVKAALKGGLTPIMCIGETLEEREAEKTMAVLEQQVTGGTAGLSPEEALNLIVAYEPIWAIGTGKTATPDMAQEAHGFIRGLFDKFFNKDLANKLRILYGGSVKPENAADLMAMEDIDGALVGGASLKPDVFIGIIKYDF
jgi:triosephosphate isomerase